MSTQLSYDTRFHSDQETSEKDDDQLDRYSIAEQLAKRIANLDTSNNSYVIGIEGEWGSGKSTFINFIKNSLAKISKKDQGSNILEIHQFNPWRYASEDDLTINFFKDITAKTDSKIIDKDFIKKLSSFLEVITLTKKHASKLKTGQSVIAFFSFALGTLSPQFPGINDVFVKYVQPFLITISGIALFWDKIINFIGDICKHVQKEKGKKTLEQRKSEIEKRAKDWRGKLIVVIDDIDRLTPKEIRQVVKLVKSQCDLPNIVYVLSYDARQISNAYKELGKEDAERYIEKIVQYEHRIPPLTPEKSASCFIQMLEKCLPLSETDIEDLKFVFDPSSEANGVMAERGTPTTTELFAQTYFSTLRDIARFTNTLTFAASPFIQNGNLERHALDLVCIELLRHFEPKVYAYIATNKRLFTASTPERAQPLNDERNNLRNKVEELANNKLAVELAAKVFSSLGKIFRGTKGVRAEYPEYFESYFQLTHPSTRLSNEDLKLIIRQAQNDHQQVVDQIRTYAKEGKNVADQIDREFNGIENVEKDGAINFLHSLISARPSIQKKHPEFSLTLSSVRYNQEDGKVVYDLFRMFIEDSNDLETSVWLILNSLDYVTKETQTKILTYYLNALKVKIVKDPNSAYDLEDVSYLFNQLITSIPSILIAFFVELLPVNPATILPFFGNNDQMYNQAKWIVTNVEAKCCHNWLDAAKLKIEENDSSLQYKQLEQLKQAVDLISSELTRAND